MPIYEYACSKCGKRYEVFQKITEPEEKKCKFCKGKVHKEMSSTAFHLKGSGWYVTDYGGKIDDNGKEKDSAPTENSDSSSSTVATEATDKKKNNNEVSTESIEV